MVGGDGRESQQVATTWCASSAGAIEVGSDLVRELGRSGWWWQAVGELGAAAIGGKLGGSSVRELGRARRWR